MFKAYLITLSNIKTTFLTSNDNSMYNNVSYYKTRQ